MLRLSELGRCPVVRFRLGYPVVRLLPAGRFLFVTFGLDAQAGTPSQFPVLVFTWQGFYFVMDPSDSVVVSDSAAGLPVLLLTVRMFRSTLHPTGSA